MTVTASAPGRVNLIGEHTDYNAGLALPLAIQQRTTAQLTVRSDDDVTVASTAPGAAPARFNLTARPGDVTGWASYVAGAFWVLREAGHELPGADIQIRSQVPPSVGLSSSAALECAVIVAVNEVAGLDLDRTTLALLAQRAENEFVGAPTGAMDHIAAVYAQAGHVVLFDAQAITAEQVPCDLAAAGLALLIVNTRIQHHHASGEYTARRSSCETAAAQLGVHTLRDVQDQPTAEVLARLDDDVIRRRVRHVLTENARVMATVTHLKAGRIRHIGDVLTASHASMRDDFEITVPEVDVAVDTALDAGALGARMTGGGFGGSIIALVESDAVSPVMNAVREAFQAHQFRDPSVFTVQPAAGARVEKDTEEH